MVIYSIVFYSGFSNERWWFSTAVSNYQEGYLKLFCGNVRIHITLRSHGWETYFYRHGPWGLLRESSNYCSETFKVDQFQFLFISIDMIFRYEYIILMDTISIHIPSYQYPLISIDIQIRMLSRHKWGSRDRRDSARIAVSARHIFHWPRMIGEIQRGQTWRHIMYVASSFDGVLCFVWFCLCVLLQCFKNAGTYWT